MSSNSANSAIYLLSIRGTLAPKTLVAARDLHNQTAGAPQNVAAARSLGDMSHMVYVPVEHDGHPFGDFLILDQWNSLDGLNQFFSNPHVQEQAGQIFSQRDPVVWAAAEGFASYHFPAPYGKNDRFVGVVRGTVRSHAEAQKVHNEIIGKFVNKSRMAGNMSHEAYLRMAAPGSPEALEFFAVDVWMDAEGMGKSYEDPEFLEAFGKLFASEPSATVWTHPDGQWVEW
ncbi:MAG TPA: hypothetical protein VKQ72_20580 [Aggregatilineales bacterium]|nr:hypothetical protein [Aggregatilineales bacterium]